MTNNKTSNLIKVAVVFLLLCVTSVRSFAENGDDGLDVALGFSLGMHHFAGTGDLCRNLQRETKHSNCAYEWGALYISPYLRLGLAPRHSVIAAYQLGDDNELSLNNSICIDNLLTICPADRTASFSVSSAVLAYEYRTLLGPDFEGFLKAGYHDSKFNRHGTTIGINGIVLGAGGVYDKNILVGYEYMDAGDELKSGHAIYMGLEFGL